ncbi:CubicO group peptidase, beta-lactamase class C family [Fodinibius roseus]|uniref:Beta-lactamase n=1 Tax=Fodinibius roseus TaxID=1194090 RepID=A0A1M4X811_9BACT|nr:serine hydrolase domain-containing protein [Fodinibius roseus]SHE89551.1 CubicO group peptidase, beta-lactamase class C family [Fodinibius roseus]
MKQLLYFLILTFIISCGSVSNPEVAVNNLQRPPGVSEAQTDHIFNTLRYYPNQTQLSIASIDDTSAVFYGAIRAGDTLQTIDNKDSVFEIGSLSKVFTSTLLANLVHHNKLMLNQPIQAYLDFPLNDSLQVSFLELANHTSGLPRIPSGFIRESLWHMDNPYKDYNEKKLRDYMSNNMEPDHEPGSTFQYSNIGAGILGYVLTRIEGQSYEEMLQQKIFQPLEMQHSTTQRAFVNDKLVAGLSKRGKTASNWDLGAIPGAGAILSTSEDLVKFGQANFDRDNKIMKLQRQETFSIDNDRAMALGWFILKRDSTTKWYWHNGGTGGYRSSMVLDVDNRKGVIVLSNISAGHSHAAQIDSLSYSLLRELRK